MSIMPIVSQVYEGSLVSKVSGGSPVLIMPLVSQVYEYSLVSKVSGGSLCRSCSWYLKCMKVS